MVVPRSWRLFPRPKVSSQSSGCHGSQRIVLFCIQSDLPEPAVCVSLFQTSPPTTQVSPQKHHQDHRDHACALAREDGLSPCKAPAGQTGLCRLRCITASELKWPAEGQEEAGLNHFPESWVFWRSSSAQHDIALKKQGLVQWV